jgi:acid stress-induced BolA-like protein IbaG/YrbA
MAIEQQITEILERELPNSQVEVTRDEDTGKVGGRVIWKGFAGYNSLRRQERIFGLLRRSLSAADAKDISFIFSYTPDEFDQLQAA